MSGGVLAPEAAGPGARTQRGTEDLFAALVPRKRRSRVWLGVNISIAGHIIILAALILVPLYWPEPMPQEQDLIRLLIYNPPPPPPPPLPKGATLAKEVKVAQPVTPQVLNKAAFTAPQDVIENKAPKEIRLSELDQTGIPEGADIGMPEGMEGGVEGGVPGGVLGGVIGGVIGGTGDGPVQDVDELPRLLRQTKPEYPQEAFIKKIEGQVFLQITIDATGRVVDARIIKSIPLLDAAAIRCVKQWVFAPAVKRGRPVATLANAPVNFRIY